MMEISIYTSDHQHHQPGPGDASLQHALAAPGAENKTHGPLYEDLDILMAPWVATAGEKKILPWDEPWWVAPTHHATRTLRRPQGQRQWFVKAFGVGPGQFTLLTTTCCKATLGVEGMPEGIASWASGRQVQ